MDLYKEWDTLNKTKFNTTLTDKEIMEALTQQSNSSLSTLKVTLRQNITWAAGFTVINIIWMLFSLNKAELLGILMVSFAMHIIYLTVTISNYRKIETAIAPDTDVAETIRTNYTILKSTLGFTKNWGLFAMPMSIITKSLIVNYYFGHTISEYFSSTHKLTSLIIYLIIFVPLANMLGSKMTKKAFGGQLDQLHKYLIQLETLEDKAAQPS